MKEMHSKVSVIRKKAHGLALALETNTIRETMRIIDKNALGIAFVVNGANDFVGLVTDGDIRRAILNGISLTRQIRDIMNTNPIVVDDSWSDNEIVSFVVESKATGKSPKYGSIRIPVLDKNRKVAGIVFVTEKGYAGTSVHSESKRNGGVNKVLVIGGAGYLGSVICRKLLLKDYRVRVLDNLTYGDSGIRDLYSENCFEFIKGDIRDLSMVVEAIKGMDAVIHLAAIVGDPASALSPQRTIEINYLSTKLVAEVCKYNQINRFIFASTCSIYGASPTPDSRLSEESPLNPVSLYAEMKIKSEEMLLDMVDGNFAPTILRMATLYGLSPRMRFDLVVNLVTAKAIFEKKIPIFGGSQWRPNLHVVDAAEAFLKCLAAPIEKIEGEAFNVGSNEQNHQIIDIGRMIHSIVSDAEIEIRESEDERNYNVSFDKISRMLDYKATRKIQDGIVEIKSAIEKGAIRDYTDKTYSNYKFLSEQSE